MNRFTRAILQLLEALRWPRTAYVSEAWTDAHRRDETTHGVEQSAIDWDAMRRLWRP